MLLVPKHLVPPTAYTEAARGLLVTSASSPKYCPLEQRATSTSTLFCSETFVCKGRDLTFNLICKDSGVFLSCVTWRLGNVVMSKFNKTFILQLFVHHLSEKRWCWSLSQRLCWLLQQSAQLKQDKSHKATHNRHFTYFAFDHYLDFSWFYNVETVGLVALQM